MTATTPKKPSRWETPRGRHFIELCRETLREIEERERKEREDER